MPAILPSRSELSIASPQRARRHRPSPPRGHTSILSGRRASLPALRPALGAAGSLFGHFPGQWYTDSRPQVVAGGARPSAPGSRAERAVRRCSASRVIVRLVLVLVALPALLGVTTGSVPVAGLAAGAGGTRTAERALGQGLRGLVEVAGTEGDGLRVRRAADPQAEILVVLDDGTRAEAIAGPVTAGGFDWYQIRYAGGETGWVAGLYLRAVVDAAGDAVPTDGAAPRLAAAIGDATAPASAAGGSSPPLTDALAFSDRDESSAPLSVAPDLQGALLVPPSIAARVGAPLRPLPPVESLDPRFGLVEAFRLADTGLDRALGARYQRITFWWRGLQAAPDAPLNPHYFPLDLLDHELHEGYQVLGLIMNTPDWAAANPADGPRSVPANLYLDWDDPQNCWGRFVERLARDYAGRVDDWIIWNEPDIQPGDPNAAYYTWAGSLDDYYQLLRVGYRSIKAGNPVARVHLAGLTYWSDRRAGRPQYFERLLERVAADPTAAANNSYFDRVTLHLYTDPRGLYLVPRLYHELMQAQGLDRPIWINETNVVPWDDPANRGTGYDLATGMRCTLADQASYLLQAFGLGLAADAERISVYKAEDGVGASLNPFVDPVERSALVREDGSLRPVFLAYQTVVRYLGRTERAKYFS